MALITTVLIDAPDAPITVVEVNVAFGGTVSSVSIVPANGVSGTVANPTTNPAVTLLLGAITPASVAATGAVSGSNLSGTNTGDETAASIESDYNAQVAVVSQAEAEAGVSTTVRRWTAQRIGQAIAALAAAGAGAVSSLFGRVGAVTAQAGDYAANLITVTPVGAVAATNVQTAIQELDTEKTTAAAALAAAQAIKLDDFAAPDDNTDRDATTALHGLMPKADKVKLDAITGSNTGDQSLAAYAPLASPTFTGVPAVPTAAAATNTTQAASTAFVRGEVAALVAAAPGTLDTLNELAVALGNDPNFTTTVTAAIGAKVTANGAITPDTKTKIAYDAKGLVTAGFDATTQDIADAFNKRYVTDANLTTIGNTSGVNTGDNVQTTITGNAGSATVLQTARTLNGASFNGSANITVPRTGVVREIWIGAGAMTPSAVNGAATGAYAPSGADAATIDVFDFDDTTSESVQFTIALPSTWNLGTVKAKFYWTSISGTGTVIWSIAGGAASDADTLGAILGTAITVTDTLLSSAQVHVTPATAAVTVGGTPVLDDVVLFKVLRDISDTKTGDARLLGVKLQYTESATEPSAW